MTRPPPVITSSVEAILASSAGLRKGTFSVEWVTAMRCVCTATAVASVQPSMLGSGGRSLKEMTSNPAASAAWATATTRSYGMLRGLMPNRIGFALFAMMFLLCSSQTPLSGARCCCARSTRYSSALASKPRATACRLSSRLSASLPSSAWAMDRSA